MTTLASLSRRQYEERRRLYVQARENVQKNLRLPITIGELTIQRLGCLLVESQPCEPAFHSSCSLWPIGYKATYRDPLTSIEYDCEIQDGLETSLCKDAPAFVIHMRTAQLYTVTSQSPCAAWTEVMTHQIDHGTERERDAAMKWESHTLGERFGLQHVQVRKLLEGLCGAFHCFRYQFMYDGCAIDIDAEPASKATPKKKGHGTKQASTKTPPNKKQKTEKSKGEDLDNGAKASKNVADGAASAADAAQNTSYRTTGPYVGKRARRFVYNGPNPTDVGDGVITGWLPVTDQGDDLYLNEDGNPADLWRLTYDDDSFGDEDLDESEVQEAIDLIDKPLPPKLQKKHEKRLEGIAAKAAKAAKKVLEKNKTRKDSEVDEPGGGLQESSPPPAPSRPVPLDESRKVITVGPYAGCEASAVPFPSASTPSLGEPDLTADFLALYAFMYDRLGGPRLSLEALQSCLTGQEETHDKVFCQAALWFTKLAARNRYVRDDDDVDGDAARAAAPHDMAHDIKLSPGPLLSANMKDSETITYTCWHLLNEATWPEIVRMLARTCLDSDRHASLLSALETLEPVDYTPTQRVAVLSFLRDEACACDRVRKVFNDKLQEIDRLLERKRVEDAALKKNKDALKLKRADAGNDGAKTNAAEGGDSVMGTEKVNPSGSELTGNETMGGCKSKGMDTLELMKLLHEQDPQPFYIKHQGNLFRCSIDANGLIPKIKSDGKVFDTPQTWICSVQKKQKLVGLAAKNVIFYKGKSLKECEANLVQSKGEDSLCCAEEEAYPSVDMERRKREFEAALRKAEKGLRLEPVGQDRAHRRYWCLEGVADRIWVSSTRLTQHDDVARGKGIKRTGDFGLDGSAGEHFVAMGKSDDEVWSCYSLHDGSLHQVYRYLMDGPKGPRETALLQQLDAYQIKVHPVPAQSDDQPQPPSRDEALSADTGGYVWKLLPKIGDIVWARKVTDDSKKGWYPVKIVDAPEDEPTTEDDEEEEGEESERDAENEWKKEGSEYIGKRVHVAIEEDVVEKGRVVGWLPADEADFVSEATGEAAALWRVKLDNKRLGYQDLEEAEVKAAIRDFVKAEALKKLQDSEYLSSKSIYGQNIKSIYGQYMKDRETVESFSIVNVLPYQEFRQERVEELRSAGLHKVLAQVERADQYLEERDTEDEPDIRVLLSALGLSSMTEQHLTPELEASIRHCLPYPRVMSLVLRNMRSVPELCSPQELRDQLLAIFDHLKVSKCMELYCYSNPLHLTLVTIRRDDRPGPTPPRT